MESTVLKRGVQERLLHGVGTFDQREEQGSRTQSYLGSFLCNQPCQPMYSRDQKLSPIPHTSTHLSNPRAVITFSGEGFPEQPCTGPVQGHPPGGEEWVICGA